MTSLDLYGLTQQSDALPDVPRETSGRVPKYVAACGLWRLEGVHADGRTATRPFRCGNRACSYCAVQIARKWTRITATGYDMAPGKVRFVTITCAPYFPPERAWLAFPVIWNALRTGLRRAFGPFEYIRAVEATKAGRPHYHLLVRGTYWPQSTLSVLAEQAGFGRVCWITKPRRRADACRYVMKYLLKDVHLPLTFRQRRVARSQGWCPDPPYTIEPGWTWTLNTDPLLTGGERTPYGPLAVRPE